MGTSEVTAILTSPAATVAPETSRFIKFRVVRIKFETLQELAKSGIVTLVLISVLGGYLIGQPSEGSFQPLRLLLTLLGVLFLASGSSALNQLQERHIDATMPRTASRPLPSGRISYREATLFIVLSLSLGLFLLSRISFSVLTLGFLAVVLYNGLYTLWWKKHWAYAAIPGAIPGALPILMGYASARGSITASGGWYLFFLLFFWQMPHFWVLALKYKDDYQKGGFPTLPVARGTGVTVSEISMWCVAYVALAFMAPLFLPVGWIYLSVTSLMSIQVIRELVAFTKAPESKKWLHFFLWVNFSLIAYIGAAAIDLWSFYLPAFWR